jgi:hypothetical protein
VLATSAVDDAAAWLGVPLAFLLTGLGVGMLVERALGLRLSAPALLPLGACTSMCAVLAIYQLGGHGALPAALLVVTAFAGLVLARHDLRVRLTPGPATAAGVLVACLYFAPAVLSGHWTWYGYNFLNDTAVQFLLADDLKHHGVRLIEDQFSTRSEVIRTYIDSGYPLGSHAQVAAIATLLGSGVDVVYQSYIGMLAVTAAVALTGIARLSGLGPWRAAAAGCGALFASLIYHYALQGSIKELAAFASLTATTLFALELLRSDQPVRAVVPLAIAAAAMVSAFSTAAGPYLIVVAVGIVVVAAMDRRSAIQARLPVVLAVGTVTTVVAALPTLVSSVTFLRVSNAALTTGATTTSTLGQLNRPLDVIQVAGVWLSENYGLPVVGSAEASLTSVLSWFMVVLAVAGAIVFVKRRQPGPLLLALSTLLTAAIVAPRASDYADAKLLALACPALVFLSLSGALALRGRLRAVGVAAAGIAALSALASAAFAYHGVRLAPVDRLYALEPAVASVADHGTILLDEVEEFGKYYGRDAPEFNVAFEPITPKQAVPFGGGYHLDLDELDQSYVQSFDALITRKSPARSRPPANYRRVYQNHFYEAWEKIARVAVQQHLPLGSTLDAGGFAQCDDIRNLAASAGPHDRLRAAEAPETTLLPVVGARDRPVGWPPLAAPPGVVDPRTPGIVERSLPLRAGAYDVWVRASTGRALQVKIDGRRVGSVKSLNSQGQWLQDGSVRLDAGHHRVGLERPGGGLAPGDGVTSVLGPVALVRREQRAVRDVAPKRARELCGDRWDWVEVVSG